jgi:MFS family permease
VDSSAHRCDKALVTDTGQRVLVNARLAAGADFTVYGFALGIWVVHIPAIRDRAGLSVRDLGIELLIFGTSSFVAMIASGRVVTRVGARNLLTAGGGAVSLSMVGPGLATSQASLTLALVVFGLAAGFYDAGQNAHAVEVERAYRRPIFNSFFALFSLGSLAAAILGGTARAVGADIRVVFLCTALLCLAVTSVASHFLLRPAIPDLAEGLVALRWSARTVLVGSASFALLLAEGVAFDWSSIHLEDVLHADKAATGAAFGAFTVTTTAVRFLADRLTSAIGPLAYLRIGTVVAVCGMSLVALSPTIPLAVAGWGLFGLGVAGCAGQVYSAAGAINPLASGAALARVTAIGYLGLLAGPSLIGFLAPHTGLRAAFVVPIVCCAYAFAVARHVIPPAAPTPQSPGSSR